ncbi:MAG: spore coat protein CotJB [Oscillospiraceae bacterium]|nr:spore coat protein CotJB [Oscillospiraceae bacterium]
MERKLLMQRLQACNSALNDAALFLDTRPDDPMALAYYEKHQALLMKTQQEYVSRWGPISRGDHMAGERWRWTDEPWPWHNSGEVS